MARADAYADVAYFQARNTGGTAVSNATALGEDLIAGSRLFDRQVGVHDGAFNSHTATYTFDSIGGLVLWLRDRSGGAYFLQSVADAGIGIDTELDGTFDGYAWDLDDAWLRGLPDNAAAFGVPFNALEILPHITTAPLTRWPDGRARVRIEGTWGWATVPDMVKQTVVSMTRELRDHFGAGAFGAQERYGDELPLSNQTWRLIASAKAEYGRRIPAF